MTKSSQAAFIESEKTMPQKKHEDKIPAQYDRAIQPPLPAVFANQIEVTQETINYVITEDRRHTTRGINLVVASEKLPSPDQNTVTTEFKLFFLNNQVSPIATLRIEEISSLDSVSRVKKTTVALTSVEKIRGPENSKSTHILAATVGDYIGKKLSLLSAAMPSDTVLDITLMFDTDRTERSISSYWEFEAAIERQIQPYVAKAMGSKVKIASAW